jgi:SAM-dependent methyltransferase
MIFGTEYASIYDSLYSDYNFMADAVMVSQLTQDAFSDRVISAKNWKLSLLDLGCGTGNHTKLLKDEFAVTGVDLSEGMLGEARKKNADVSFHQGDARTFNLEQQFDVVIMMSAVLGYQLTNEAVIETLKNANRHTKPGGLFIFDVWNGPGVLLQKPTPKLKEIKHGDCEIMRSVKPFLDTGRSTCTCHYKWWVPVDGKIITKEESHTVRYFFQNEMKLFLELAGFKLFRVGKQSNAHRDVDILDWHIMFAAISQK